MHARRISTLAVAAAAVALPFVATPSAQAATHTAPATTSSYCTPTTPYQQHAKTVRLHTDPSAKSTTIGILYKSHGFKAHKRHGNWVLVTDKKTGVRGWASNDYIYRTAGMCLD